MKTVFNNDQVKHVWAQQRQESGRGNGSTSFEGPTLYSYGTPIANFITQKIKGPKRGQVTERKICLITTVSYSVSTTRHMPHISDIPGGIPVFNVKHIGIDRGRAPNMPSDWLKDNLVELAKDYTTELAKLSRVRDQANIDWRVNHLHVRKTEAARYAETMGIKFNIEKHFPAPDAETLAAMRMKLAKESKAKAAKTKAHAEQMRKDYAPQIAEFLAGQTLSLNYHATNYASPADKKLIKARYIELWREGEIHHIDMSDKTRLRVRYKDEKGLKIVSEIETSRGASFPAAHGLKALPIIRRVKASGEPWHTNGHKIHLGPFQIDRIEADGTVYAGCHTVTYDEIELVAKQLNAGGA